MTEPDDKPDEPVRIDARDARGAEIILTKRRHRAIFVAGLVGLAVLALVGLAGCSGGEEEQACGGILLSAPEDGSGSCTISELMAHSAAMGMTREEAETLLYLEGISPGSKLAAGETLCVDGQVG